MQRQSMERAALAADVRPLFLQRRPEGERVYPHLQAALEATPEGEMLLLQFTSEQNSDPSFMDASFIELADKLLQGQFGDRGLALQGLNESLIYNIECTLSRKRELARREGRDFKVVFLAFTLEPPPGRLPVDGWSILGTLEPSLMDVLCLLTQRQSLSAADVASAFDLELNTASMRLKRLYERHLIRREYQALPHGREFVYVFWR